MQPSMQDFSLVVLYERMNLLKCRNSTRIVTDKVLEDFLLAGMLGMPIDTDNYTASDYILLFGIKVVLKSTNHLNMMPFSICLMK
jgi:hypothetical protein